MTLRAPWVSEAESLGLSAERTISDGTRLREMADQVVKLASDLSATRLLAGSADGQVICGAALALAANGLRPLGRDDHDESVLLVDSVLASGMQLLRARRRVLEQGCRSVGSVVLERHSEATPAAELEPVVVLGGQH